MFQLEIAKLLQIEAVPVDLLFNLDQQNLDTKNVKHSN